MNDFRKRAERIAKKHMAESNYMFDWIVQDIEAEFAEVRRETMEECASEEINPHMLPADGRPSPHLQSCVGRLSTRFASGSEGGKMTKLDFKQRAELQEILSNALDEDDLAEKVAVILAKRDFLKERLREARETFRLLTDLIYVRGDDCGEHITIAEEALKKLQMK